MKVLILSVIFLILGLLDILNPLRNVVHSVSAPIQFGLRRSAISIKDTMQLFHNVDEIRRENLELRQDIYELQTVVINLKRFQEENEILRYQLELKNKDTFDKELLMASVMGNSGDLTGASIILDKGSRHGVKINDNVVLGNFLVGKVTKLNVERCVVTMITSPNLSISVKNLDSGAEGIARGNLGTSVLVTRLLPGEKIDLGSVFVTSGKDGNFLPNLGLGLVSEVSFESAEPLKNANLDPLIDFQSLEKVFIVL